MQLKVLPAIALRGALALPASKSYSIRSFFVAACGGRSRIINPSDCDDAVVALAIARAFGSRVRAIKSGYEVSAGPVAATRPLKVKVRESGTSLRFVLPLLPFFSSTAEVNGSGTLVGRPNHHLCAALRDCGLLIQGAGAKESVPVIYSGGTLTGGRIVIDGSLSSQFVSALMIAAPLAQKDTRLVMAGDSLVSRDYVVMTRQILARAGIQVVPKGRREFLIPGGQGYKGLKNFKVPSDLGLAAFFMVAAALVPADITLQGFFDDSLVQSDGAILGFLAKMGLKFTRTAHAIKIKGPQRLQGGVFSLKDCPDLVPIMAVAAMFASGPVRLKDIGHARVKESDRISDLRKELLKVGANIEEKPDEMLISPGVAYKSGVTLDPHNDHRLAMAFAVLGLKLGVKVDNIECTKKSYPGFVKALASVR
ncbi:MAG: 3-phosphoshikimate 1-carboxyvinyltransferase [Candidatus Omnitrophica bacterium]|nr:3-phosphoshikimate 1-carboxyvinyltransferase [Candidatus Omnitrophota bacterium]